VIPHRRPRPARNRRRSPSCRSIRLSTQAICADSASDAGRAGA
jgi:hypothetical protein